MRPARSLTPGTALVTGASSGIGAATARLLARQGYRLAVQSRGGQGLEDVANRTGAQVCVADLTEQDAAQRLHVAVEARLGALDLLVCNAGVGWEGQLADMPAERIEHLMRLNLVATMQLVRVFGSEMARRGRGHIVLVSSIAGSMGVPREAVYSASKAGLRVFGQSMGLELAGTGVGVTVVNPGAVDTAFFERRGSPYQRDRPRPVPAERVAQALLRGVRRGQQEVFVPAWLRVPARLQGAAPGPVNALRRLLD